MGNHLRSNKGVDPRQATVSDSLELELLADPEQMTQFSEAFSVHPTDKTPVKLLPENIFEFAGGRQLEVLIKPSVIQSDENLKSLTPSDRSCYFKEERKLQFFKIYTRRNCEMECFSNFSLSICNCIPFYHIRDAQKRICGITEDSYGCQYKITTAFIAAGVLASSFLLVALRFGYLQHRNQRIETSWKQVSSDYAYIV